MPYHTAKLPDPIRQQVEDFIEFLLWKHKESSQSAIDETSEKGKAIRALARQYQALATVDEREAEEILYDENGLPKRHAEP